MLSQQYSTTMVLGLLLSCSPVLLTGAEEQAAATTLPSKIDAVTVYLDRAQVTRHATLPKTPGRHRLRIDNLPIELEDPTVRLQLPDGVALEQLSIETVVTRRNSNDATAAIRSQIKEQERILVDVHDQRQQWIEQKSVLKQLQDTHLQAIKHKEKELPAVSTYQEFFTFLSGERQRIATGLRELQEKERKAKLTMAELNAKLAQEDQGELIRSKSVHITVRSKNNGELKLTYLVPGASWFPNYDCRTNSGFDNVQVSYGAMIQNATGEDWSGVTLTLSAARPMIAVKPPRLLAMRVDQQVVRAQVVNQQQAANLASNASPSVQAIQMGSNTPNWTGNSNLLGQVDYNGTISLNNDFDGNNTYNPVDNLVYQQRNRYGKNKKAHAQLMCNFNQIKQLALIIDRRRTSVIFTIPGTHSIRADGNAQRIPLRRTTVPMKLERYAVPSASLNTFRAGLFTNSIDLPMLPGRAQVFIGADLIGGVDLPFIATGEKGSLYLGVDERVRVRRVFNKEHSEMDRGSRWTRIDAQWQFTVENFTDQTVALRIEEALPTSRDDSIRVRVRKVEPEVHADADGRFKWKLTAPTGKSDAGLIRYSIEFENARTTPALQRIMARF